MTLDAEGDPPRSAHQDILEDEQTMADHVVDVLPIYHRIVAIKRADIKIGEFGNDTHGISTILVTITET